MVPVAAHAFRPSFNPALAARPGLGASGDADRSHLHLKVLGDPSITGSRMPLGGPFLTADQIKLIHDWIVAGALDN